MQDGSQPSDVRETNLSDAARTRATIGDCYRVERLIAEGGMATVFLAEDLKHGRHVAVKVLHEALAHTIGIQRFLREIEVIARLQHPHLLTLIDSGTTDGLPYYVMPYVEALSLRETIAERKRLPVDEAVMITREVSDALEYAHKHGVIHRDIKPSNILMSGGHAMVADFGIATALQNAAVGRLTETGISLGSPTYMSPEQAAGERDVDARSDVYSLACVLYEMLAGEPPIDHASMQQVITRKLTGAFKKLRENRADVPVDLEAVIHRALTPDREARFASIQEFSAAVSASLPRAHSTSTRARWLAVAAVFVLVVTGGAALLRRERRTLSATQRVAEINSLVLGGKYAAAFQLAQRVLPVIPHDSALLRLRPLFTDFIKIVTVPADARVSIRRLGGTDTAWTEVGRTPLDSAPMPKFGNDLGYRIRIERDGYQRVDVLQSLFTDLRSVAGPAPLDTLHLDRLGESTAGMVRIRGFRDSTEGRRLTLADYHIGKNEVTNREYMRFVAADGYHKREYWTEPMLLDGRAISWERAIAEFRDRTGLPGPSTWSGGSYPAGQEDYPVGGVSYYEAAAYARFAGKHLPTAEHWRRAALRNDREAGWMFMPSANVNGTRPRPVGQGIFNTYGLFDISGNVREWCVNPIDSGRLTRGGGWEDAEFHVGHRIPKPEFDRSASNGFRLVSLSDDDTTIAQLSGRIPRSVPRDYRHFVAVPDAEFAIYRRMYDYDPRPLDVRPDTGGARESFTWLKVSFTAAYGGERMAAYLFLPKDARPPYEPIIVWLASNAMTDRHFDPGAAWVDNALGFIPRSGRAMVVPLLKGTYERDDSAFSMVRSTADSTTYYRDLTVQWIKDLRRTVDYIGTRSDLKADRIGYYGVSWGGAIAPVALAMEPRIRAAVLYSAGYWVGTPARQEVDAANYAPRVRTATLMLNGRYDAVFPYATSQLPLFQQLGTAAHDKKLLPYDWSHILPQEIAAREALTWFDRYLSGGGASGRP